MSEQIREGQADEQTFVEQVQAIEPETVPRGEGPNGEFINGVDCKTAWHFYRCNKCGSLLTRDDEKKAVATGKPICVCMGNNFSPSMPTLAERESAQVKTYMLKWGFDSWPDEEEIDPADEMGATADDSTDIDVEGVE
jgi:hypothetical protein